MNPRMLEYYNQELQHIRESAAEFAREYPKIASRLTRTYTDRHGLKELVRELLGQEVSKAQQSSDWGSPVLSEAQKDRIRALAPIDGELTNESA